MQRFTMTVGIFLFLALITATVHAKEEKHDKTVYFLVHSGACNCQKRMCQQAKPIGLRIKARLADNVEYVSLDYGTEPEKVEAVTRKYRILTFPAVLVVGLEGKELFKKQGRLERNEVLKDLQDLGAINEEKSE